MCTHAHIHTHISDTHTPKHIAGPTLCMACPTKGTRNQGSWPLCPLPSPLDPENINPNRPQGLGIRGSRAKEFVKKSSWKGFAKSRFEACPGPTADRLGELPPPTPGSPPAPSCMALAASTGTDTDGVVLAAARAGSLPSPKLE